MSVSNRLDAATLEQIRDEHVSDNWEGSKSTNWAHGQCDVVGCESSPKYKLFLPKIHPVPALCHEHREYRKYSSTKEIIQN